MDKDQAERIAIAALEYLAAGEDRLARFLNATGLRGETIRQSAAAPAFLRGVVEYVMSDETTAAECAAHAGLSPFEFIEVRRALAVVHLIPRTDPIRRPSESRKPPKVNVVSLMPRRALFRSQSGASQR